MTIRSIAVAFAALTALAACGNGGPDRPDASQPQGTEPGVMDAYAAELQAASDLHSACISQDGEACFEIAERYAADGIQPSEERRVASYYKMACEAGYEPGCEKTSD